MLCLPIYILVDHCMILLNLEISQVLNKSLHQNFLSLKLERDSFKSSDHSESRRTTVV